MIRYWITPINVANAILNNHPRKYNAITDSIIAKNQDRKVFLMFDFIVDPYSYL
jgi:hypothetical protein